MDWTPSISLKVTSQPGAHLTGVCKEVIELADKLQVFVETSFNGVTLIGRPNDDPELLAANWERELHSKRSVKIACANPL